MSSWGPSWGPSQPVLPKPWDPPAPPRRGRVPWPLLVLPVLLLAGAGAVVWSAASGDDEPVEWDPQLAELASFVERERGLEFEQPVPVEYLSDEEWADEVGSGSADLTDEERQDVEDTLQFLRALGLAEGDVDLADQFGEFSASALLAYYDFNDKRVRINADGVTELPVDVQGTLVHELTHALQDQRFDINSIYGDPEADNSFAVEALIEGDAVNVQGAWIETLTPEQQEEIYAVAEEGIANLDEIDVPVALRVTSSAPYDLGPALAYLLDALGGSRLDDAFRSTPQSDEQVFDPVSFVDGDEPREVDPPAVPEGADEIDSGTFGALGLYVVLSERIDAHQAFNATDGWGGDAFVQYRDGDDVCVRVRYVGDSPGDTKEVFDALEAWVESLPSKFARVESDGDTVDFRSCDPGAGATLRTGKSVDAMWLPVVRGQVEAGSVEEGASPDEARCFANKVIDDSTLEELADPAAEKWSSEAWQVRANEFVLQCL